MAEISRQKIWDARKSQKGSYPLQDDEIKWLSDRINHGISTPQDSCPKILENCQERKRRGSQMPSVHSEKAQAKLKSACAASTVQQRMPSRVCIDVGSLLRST